MRDIVERLRMMDDGEMSLMTLRSMHDAAAEIERLRGLLKEAGEALEGILEYVGPFDDLEDDRAALEAAHAAYERASTVLSKIKGDA